MNKKKRVSNEAVCVSSTCEQCGVSSERLQAIKVLNNILYITVSTPSLHHLLSPSPPLSLTPSSLTPFPSHFISFYPIEGPFSLSFNFY